VNDAQRGILLPIGGAEDKTGECAVLRRFVERCGGAAAEIVIIPTASSFPCEVTAEYAALFARFGAARTAWLHVQSRSESNHPDTLARLGGASGIFLTGGTQLKLSAFFAGTQVGDAIRRLNRGGVPVAGTSAGASAMSRQMIGFGRGGAQPSQRMVQLGGGLGLAERLIIDQHFTQRSRLGRLMTAVALNPGMIGVGLDEDTALEIQPNGECEVIGSGTVTIIDGRQLTFTDIYSAKGYSPVRVEGVEPLVLGSGQTYTLAL
jgi:cyanophycinase